MLGLEKDAQAAEMKRAYRKLVRKYHPDHNKSEDAEEKFKEVQEAYEVLSNDEKRSAYDQYGHAATDGFGAGGPSGFSGFGGGSPFDMGDLSDILNQVMGGIGGGNVGFDFGFGNRGRSGATRSRRGADIKKDLKLDFEEAIWGVEHEIDIERYVACEKCGGSGAKDKKMKKCKTCDGQGRVQRVQRSILGNIATVAECPDCSGRGETPKEKCDDCGGKAIKTEKKKTKIKIPEGSFDGMVLRFRNGGHAGEQGGEYGDLYIELQVTSHETFERRDDDIYIDLTIPVTMAVLGGELDVPTIHGDMRMKIPAGTQPGAIFRLSKKGAPKLNGRGFGDEYVRTEVEIPKKLKKDEKKLWEELRESQVV